MGSLLRVNNVQGTPFINIGGTGTNVISLHGKRKSGSNAANGLQVGQARVYSYAVTDASYSGASTEFDLHLYDIQTFTILKCGAFSGSQVVTGARIRGLSSGAIGYAAKNAGSTGSNEIALSQTTGTFIKGEQIIINEKQTDQFISVKDIVAFTIDDVKMVFQDADGLDASLPSDFSADTVLYDRVSVSYTHLTLPTK